MKKVALTRVQGDPRARSLAVTQKRAPHAHPTHQRDLLEAGRVSPKYSRGWDEPFTRRHRPGRWFFGHLRRSSWADRQRGYSRISLSHPRGRQRDAHTQETRPMTGDRWWTRVAEELASLPFSNDGSTVVLLWIVVVIVVFVVVVVVVVVVLVVTLLVRSLATLVALVRPRFLWLSSPFYTKCLLLAVPVAGAPRANWTRELSRCCLELWSSLAHHRAGPLPPPHLNRDHDSHRIRAHVYTHASRVRDAKRIKHPRARPRPISDNDESRSDARTRLPTRSAADQRSCLLARIFGIITMTAASWDSFSCFADEWLDSSCEWRGCVRLSRCLSLSRVVQQGWFNERMFLISREEARPRHVNHIYLFICCGREIVLRVTANSRGVIRRDHFAR